MTEAAGPAMLAAHQFRTKLATVASVEITICA